MDSDSASSFSFESLNPKFPWLSTFTSSTFLLDLLSFLGSFETIFIYFLVVRLSETLDFFEGSASFLAYIFRSGNFSGSGIFYLSPLSIFTRLFGFATLLILSSTISAFCTRFTAWLLLLLSGLFFFGLEIFLLSFDLTGDYFAEFLELWRV